MELVLVHHYVVWRFLLRITPVSSGRLLVNTKHFSVRVIYSQSLKLLNGSLLHLCKDFCDLPEFMNTHAVPPWREILVTSLHLDVFSTDSLQKTSLQ